MTAKELTKKYPEEWQSMYDDTMIDLDDLDLTYTVKQVIAHNAAFNACSILDGILSGDKD